MTVSAFISSMTELTNVQSEPKIFFKNSKNFV